MANSPAPADEDDDLTALRQAMRGVTALAAGERADLARPRPAPQPRTRAPEPPSRMATTSPPNTSDAHLRAWLEARPLAGGNARPAPPASEPPPSPPQNLSEFARLFGQAEPVDTRNRVWLDRQRPQPVARQQELDNAQVLQDSLSDHLPWIDEDDNGDELLFLRPGLPRDILRKLRRGDWVIQAEIDFHGCTVDEARQRFSAFMLRCRESGLRCLRLVHGKGLSSRNREPVIKPKLRGWLIQRDDVLAFCPARPFDGGNGAVIVLLQGQRHTRPPADDEA